MLHTLQIIATHSALSEFNICPNTMQICDISYVYTITKIVQS